MIVISGDDKIKVATQNVGRLIDMLAKAKLRQEVEESDGSRKSRFL